MDVSAIPFRPSVYEDGYPPIEAHGLLGDGATTALVAADGTVDWLCVPRFDSPPVFASLLDADKGGCFRLRPRDLRESRQYYLPDTGVLVTEMRAQGGLVRVTDALLFHSGADLKEDVPAGRRELARRVEVLEGEVELVYALTFLDPVETGSVGGRVEFSLRERSELCLRLSTDNSPSAPHGSFRLKRGERRWFLLDWRDCGPARSDVDIDGLLDATCKAWREWLTCFRYQGPDTELVKRSAITLKMLDHLGNGAMIAAPTSSLPENIGGERNWDYRYAWVRDAAFSVYALRRIGLVTEAEDFLLWILDVAERDGRPHVCYTIDEELPLPERIDRRLSGYRGSGPVRWGNDAAEQMQHDVFGEILDCAWQWVEQGNKLDDKLWGALSRLADQTIDHWRMPGKGIWEMRSNGSVFTYSAGICHVALDRAVRLSEQYGYPADTRRWKSEREAIQKAILNEGWNDHVGSLTQQLGGEPLDAALLALPLRRVIPATHPRMVATTQAVRERLDAGGGLLYRYLPHVSDDGLPGAEGAFLLCSFWLVDVLTLQGRIDEALEIFDRLCKLVNPLGLWPEQIDPITGGYLGNYPQALSHVGFIAAADNLARARNERGD